MRGSNLFTRSTALSLLCIILSPLVLRAQTTEDSIKSSVNVLFDAMRKSDSAGIVACFTSNGLLQSVMENGNVETVPVLGFAHHISRIPPGDADERPTFDVIRVNGNLAVVWTPYQFYYKKTLHHCGADSFQLVRQSGGWKIQYIIDTERKNGCE